jgi:hypothetical protein
MALLLCALVLLPGMGFAGRVEASAAHDSATETLITLGSTITVAGYNVAGVTVAGTTATITAGGEYRATGILADGMIAVNTLEAVTLTLDGVTIVHTSGPAIYGINAGKLTLVLVGTNALTDGSSNTQKAALFCNDPLEISGSGALAVTGVFKHGITSDDTLVISGGVITIVSAKKDGLHANDDITISGGAVTVTQAGSDGLESEGTFAMAGGELTITATSDGIRAASSATIGDGTIHILAATEGIESESDLVVNGGSLAIATSDDGLNASTSIAIHGGQLYLNASGDGIDSNGTLSISGGTIVTLGGAAESGLACSATCTIDFSGGTVVAAGGSNSTPASSSTQYVVGMGSRTADASIYIPGLLTYKVSKDLTSLLFTSPSIAASTTYPVYSGGTISGGSDFHGLYTGASYSGGRPWQYFTTSAMLTYATDAISFYLPTINR